MDVIDCQECGKPFDRPRGRGNPPVTCSDDCRRKRINRRMRERYLWDEKYRAAVNRKRGGNCARCGKEIHKGTGSRPAGERVCRVCGWAGRTDRGRPVLPDA